MGCGCCQTSTGPTPDGLSMPLGSVILDHLTPLAPSSLAIASPGGIMRLRLSRERSRISGWPQSAQCAACHQYISMWNLPNQELTPRPVSCGGSCAGVVDGHEVLREDDAALQLGGAGVRVAGEVDDSAGGPVLPPVGARGGFDGGEGVGRIGRCRYGVSDQPIV